MLLNDETQQFEIGGVNALEIAASYGTPLFVYDSNKIISQYKKMKQALGQVKKLKINYACKALTNLSVLKLLKNLGAGLDAVSYQEIRLGLEAGFAAKDIIYTPNSVSIEELEAAMKLGVKVNIDNIETLEYMGVHHPNQTFCIRINPHIMAGGNAKISVGHIDSKFGISIHQMPLVERLVKTLNIKVEGVHMHTGSDILDVDVFSHAATLLFNVARKFDDLKYIDFGSGFKVKYKSNDIETDMEQFGEMMSERFNAFCEETGKDLTLAFEPGKFLVSEAGYFLARTNVVKQTTSTVFAGIDTGFNHMIRPMFYGAHHEIINASNPNGKPKIYTVVGYICETDTFGWNRKINEIKEGDVLCFKNAGAYCFSMASNYNSRYRPAEVLVHNGQAHLIRQRETFEDLLRNQIVPELDFSSEEEQLLNAE
ncbi:MULTISPECIES: diaminopimelate decarboxylase [unclassified Aureispira]|uniref:diaminopimelate decarboxylase n=1 Tax=unclassified Aureispira TaxID=2649989 RepID=UPI000695E51F|nr:MULTISPECIES: diaminopimelate decarboxylase [unclassified Aureispira]WMX16144.1 diaminopimelate decarboxylase [Aureispira sp. CCB-E]